MYDDEIENHIAFHNGMHVFPFKKEGFRLMNKKVPSANIAFDEKYISKMIEDSNLNLENKIYGTWSKRTKDSPFVDFQDILVFSKG